MAVTKMAIGRNDLCPCKSGKKYKQCCMNAAPEPVATVAKKTASALLKQALAYYQSGNLQQAEALGRQIIVQEPDFAEGWHLLGILATKREQWEQALTWLDKAIALMPTPTVVLLTNKASVLLTLNHLTELMGCYDQILAQQPNNVPILVKQANLQFVFDRLTAAQASYEQLIALGEEKAVAYEHLGHIALRRNKDEVAIEYFRQALALQPDLVDAHNGLGNCLKTCRKLEEALASYDRALQLEPKDTLVHSNRLLLLQYLAHVTPKEIFEAHLQYGKQFEEPLKPLWPRHERAVHSHERLRIGYVSADFRRHSVASFLEPILANHDKARVEIYCYYSFNRSDKVTKRLMTYADHWIWCVHLTDAQLVEQIRQDEIDILVDLSGHTGYNRLPMFAHKPAPIQITWIGYPGTTGLTAMDYRLTDAAMDPEGMTEAYHTEKLVRLSYVAPFKPADNSPDVNELPALAGKPFTLAALQSPNKINPAVIALWAQILKALPLARLMLGGVRSETVRKIYVTEFAEHGIDESRLVLKGLVPIAEFLALHHQIDLVLDPFPYGGGTTTNHALWMGVPVVTLAGRNTAARHGVYNLTVVGLTEFITYSEEEYVARVVELASDLPKLNQMRQSLRERISTHNSQPAELTRELEATYFQMYNTWLAEQEA